MGFLKSSSAESTDKTIYKEYRIVADTNPVQLTENINHNMTLGWQPVGGLTVLVEKEHILGKLTEVTKYFQAMVK